MGKRTGRPRGAPKGNRNRLIHGYYAAEARARRRFIRQMRAKVRAAIAQAQRLAAGTRMDGPPIPSVATRAPNGLSPQAGEE